MRCACSSVASGPTNSAKQIEVELPYDERQVRLRVRDDGKGIDPEVLRAEGWEGHFGLSGMRERAKLAGGKLTIWSALDRMPTDR
jgi:signal transduction histidine kinase